jgi:5-methylcytosine-specific restriction protein A
MPTRPTYHKPYTLPEPAPRVRQPDTRATAPERGYDGAWAKLRKMYINRRPMCEWTGCQQPGEIVDHVQPVATHPHRRLDMTNLQTLCRSHHGVKTARDLKR